MRKVNVGVVGLGNMGGCGHIIWLSELENMNLAACCDRIPEKAKSFGEKYNIPYFTDAEEMMKSGLIEAIVIAVPHYDHTTIAIRAFELGLHVLTEKPVAVHKNDVLRMIKAHEAHPDKLFAAMFQMRLTPVYQKMRELIRRNEFGKILRVNWIVTTWFRSQHYYDSGDWRATWKGEGGGVLLNQCPHNLDLLQWICGMPSKVYSKMAFGKWHDIEVEDDVTTVLEFANGATGTFITTTGDCPGTNRFEITLDGGKLVEQGSVDDVFMHTKSAAGRRLFGILPDQEEIPPQPAIRIVFDGESAEQPIISKLVKEIGLDVNILSADIRQLNQKAYGQMMIARPDDPFELQQVMEYLRGLGMTVEEVHVP